MKLLITSLFFVSALLHSAFGEVREIKRMAEIASQISEGTLVVFDIDNTLLRPNQSLGSDQWFGYLVKGFQDQGASEPEAIEKAIQFWTKIQNLTPISAVERTTPRLIFALQQKGIPVMALTARPMSFARKTIEQLASVGIDLSKTAPSSKTRRLGQALYANGIIFVGNLSKGPVLRSFLETESNAQRFNLPKRIVFTDDKAKHTESLEQAFAHSEIDYKGFRYGALDAWVASFNPAVVQTELDYLSSHHIFIKDSQALCLIKGETECGIK